MNTQFESSRPDRVLTTLQTIEYLHRASAHIQMGWIVKIPSLEIKLRLARYAHGHMEQSFKLERQIWALTRNSSPHWHIPTHLVEAMRSIDATTSSRRVLVGLYDVVLPRLAELYRSVLSRLHPVLDATVEKQLHDFIKPLQNELNWAAKLVGAITGPGFDATTRQVSALWDRPDDGAMIARNKAIWSPLDRAPTAIRPDTMPRAVAGALRAIPENAWTDPNGIGLAMHNQMHGEFTTMELMSRCAYEHPDLPAQFHLDMSRHACDEARHAEIFAELAAKFDVQYGDYPIYTLTYDGYYEFEPQVIPGSKRELLWRISLRGTIDEGLALDDLEFQAQSRDYLEQHDIAEACRYILADETFHVQGALKWVRYLCDDDEQQVVSNRLEAKEFLDHRLRSRRFEFEQSHADLVAAELEQRRRIAAAQRPSLPFKRVMNATARRLAGYTEADLQCFAAWGYVDAR